jgi:hypothetical protein
MKKKSKCPKDLSFPQKITDIMMLNQVKREKKTNKESNTRGHDISFFGKTFQRQKVKKQALVILSLKIP